MVNTSRSIAESAAIDCGGVRFASDRIALIESGREVLSIPKAGVRRIILRYGLQAQHPMVQLVLGIVLALAGLVPFPVMLLIAGESRMGLKLAAGAVMLAMFGLWLLYESLKRGYYVYVETTRSRKKVPFSKRVPLEEIHTAVEAARRVFDYPLENDAGVPLAK